MTQETLHGAEGATEGRWRTIVALTIDQTPHTTLRPNDRTHERTKARHRKTLKEAALLATHNALMSCPQIAQDAREGRLRLRYQVIWERGRKLLDGDSGLIVLKAATDGIAQKLERNDRDFVFHPVQQSFTDARQGVVIVVIQREGETNEPC